MSIGKVEKSYMQHQIWQHFRIFQMRLNMHDGGEESNQDLI